MKLSNKIQILELLSNDSLSPEQMFNQCLVQLTTVPSAASSLRHYNTSGYSPQRLESIVYDLKKAAGITDIELATYKSAQAKIKNDGVIQLTPTDPPAGDPPAGDPEEKLRGVAVVSLKKDLSTAADAAKQGYSLRAEFPFLFDKECPDVFKILVADKITAFEDFLKGHENLSVLVYGDEEKGIEPQELTNEELYLLGAQIIEDFKLNEDIYEELTYYRDNNEVLGKHPKLKDLALQQEVDAMNKATLEKNLKNYKAYNARDLQKIKKAKTEDKRLGFQAKIKEREHQMTLMQARLEEITAPKDDDDVDGQKE